MPTVDLPASVVSALQQAGLLPATQAVTTTCDVPTLQGTPCKRVTEGGPCKQHTPEKLAERDANVAAREERNAERAERTSAWLAERAEAVRSRVGEQGAFDLLVKANGTVASRSRRDLAAVGVRGVRKNTPVAEAVGLATQAGLSVRLVSALTGEPIEG